MIFWPLSKTWQKRVTRHSLNIIHFENSGKQMGNAKKKVEESPDSANFTSAKNYNYDHGNGKLKTEIE